MSEEKIDAKKLTISKAIDLFLEGKISKDDMKDAFDKRSLFKLDSRKLEDVLYIQKKDSSKFPKKLRIKSSDIVYEYGRTLSSGQFMNLAERGYVSEADVLKALKKSKVITILAAVAEKESKVEADKKEGQNKDKREEKGDTKDSKNSLEDEKEEESEKLDDNNVQVKTEQIKPDGEEKLEVQEFSEDDILTKERVSSFFSADRLLKMFFAKKMTKEFTEAYEDAFKGDDEHNQSKSKQIIKELKEIFKDNLQALYIILIRLHFRGMVLAHDIEDIIKAEFFREKIFETCDEYDVLDKEGNVIYSYKRVKKASKEDEKEEVEQEDSVVILALEDGKEKSDASVDVSKTESVLDESDGAELSLDLMPETEDYSILEPLTKEEVIDAYKDSNIDGNLFKQFFSMSELLQMYKQRKISVKVFSLFDENKRKSEILKAYKEGYIHLEEIMELFFDYDGITAKELKSIIKEMPKKVAIVRYITFETEFKKIFELYKNKLIDFNVLCMLRDQSYISLEEFEQIRNIIDKDKFYESIELKTFYTSKLEEKSLLNEQIVLEQDSQEVVEENRDSQEGDIKKDKEVSKVESDKSDDEEKENKAIVEISDGERMLLTKVLGISEEEIENISIIDSKDENGQPTVLDGYQIISDKKDGLVIFGKFDYESPIFVMGYEEASYFLRSRNDEDDELISDDLMFVERLETNNQVRVVEHDENMGKTILQALCDLSEVAQARYSENEQYIAEVREYIKTIDEHYIEMMRESKNNM